MKTRFINFYLAVILLISLVSHHKILGSAAPHSLGEQKRAHELAKELLQQIPQLKGQTHLEKETKAFAELFLQQDKNKKDYSFKEKFFDITCSIALFPMSLVNIAHEFGHALAAKTMTGAPISIHMGANQSEVFLLKQSEPGIHFHRYKPYEGGFTDKGNASLTKHQDIASTIAGPLFGIAAAYSMNTLFNAMRPLEKLKSNNRLTRLGAMCVWGLKFLCYLTISHQIEYGFTPLGHGTGSDGYKTWKLLGMPEKYLNKLKDCPPLLAGALFLTKYALSLRKLITIMKR